MTLAELMIAVAIIGVGILGFFGSFNYISRSLHVSRTRTLATNLGQEKIESLKNLSYYDLLVTTASAAHTLGFAYDTSNYPPETISIGGITFMRYTLVSFAQVQMPADTITTVNYTSLDTGLKQITVNVVWADNGVQKKWTLVNLLENPNVTPLDASITGTITKATGGALPGAWVRTEENPNYSAVSDANGNYSFTVYHGSYTVRASSAGYLDAIAPQTVVSAGGQATVSLSLTAIATGTVTGNVWYAPNAVVSQVVASTTEPNGYNAQYVELYNPTTAQINVATAGGSPLINLNFASANPAYCPDVALTYVSTSIPSNHYYLIANTGTFVLGGITYTADAYYTDTADSTCNPYYSPTATYWNPPSVRTIIGSGHSGLVWLTDSSGNVIDAVGWTKNTSNPHNCGGNCSSPSCNGTCISFSNGIPAGEQVVRISSPAATLAAAGMGTYGRAYNSQNNANDFFYPGTNASFGIQYPPSNTSSSAMTPIAGIPAVGAYVAASDPYSGSTQAYAAYITSGSYSLLYAPFNLVGVSTSDSSGWLVDIASGSYYVEIGTVVVNQGAITAVPNAATVPAWTASGLDDSTLDATTTGGFIKGNVSDINGAPLSGISVIGGGGSKTTGANGDYFLTSSSGPVEVVANPSNANPTYVQSQTIITVNTGQITFQNFILSQGGSLSGYLTTGTSPLPGFPVTALNAAGNQAGTSSTDSSGHFTIANLSTGTYTVEPIVNSKQGSSPSSASATLTASATTIFVGTFTITGAMGSIAGTVTLNGSTVTTGALILASTATISTPPPAIYASSSTALTTIYGVSSLADGTYTLPVSGSATYYLSVSVPTVNGTGTTVTQKTYTNIYVSPSQTTTKNLSLP